MRRKRMLLWAMGLLVVVAVTSTVLLTTHLERVAEQLFSSLTDTGVEIGEMEVILFPPSVSARDLTIVHGGYQAEVARAVFRPDVTATLRGELRLREMVVEQLVVRGMDGGDRFGPLPDLFPERIKFVDASIFLTANEGESPAPVLFSAVATRSGDGFSVQIERLSSSDLGVALSGELEVRSLEPFSALLRAESAALDSAAMVPLLAGSVGAQAAGPMEQLGALETHGLMADYSGETGALDVTAGSVVTDAGEFGGVRLELASDGRWALAAEEGTLAASKVLDLVQGADAISQLGLEKADILGCISLESCTLSGRAYQPVAASAGFAGADLQVNLVARSGLCQKLAIREVRGTAKVGNGQPSVNIERMILDSTGDGKAEVAAEAALPPKFGEVIVDVEANGFEFFGLRWDGHAGTTRQGRIDFDLGVSDGAVMAQGRGMLTRGQGQSDEWAMVLDELVVETDSGEETHGSKPFSLDNLPQEKMAGKVVCRRFRFNDLPEVVNLVAEVACSAGVVAMSARGTSCRLAFTSALKARPGWLSANLDVATNQALLPQVLGCFVDELPVFLRGRSTMRLGLKWQGESFEKLSSSLRGNAVVRVADLEVLRLSTLDSRLGFFATLVNAAGLELEKMDSLAFREGVLSAAIDSAGVTIKSARLDGNALSALATGRYSYEGGRLVLDSAVLTRFGTRDKVKIDMSLFGEEDT